MATCCVCKHHYDPGTPKSFDCPRCESDNTEWERVHRGEHFWDTKGWQLVLFPGLIFAGEIFTAASLVIQNGRLQPLGSVVVVIILLASLLVVAIGYAVRFRLREYSLRREVITAKRPSLISLIISVPLISLALTLALSLLPGWLVPVLPETWLDRVLPESLVKQFPDAIDFFSYVFMYPCLIFSATLLVIKRYVGSLDLPSPIFLDVDKMRQVAIEEYCHGKRAGVLPNAIVCREFSRTDKGGVSMTLSWMDGTTPKKVKLECDQWARLVSAKEEVDKS
jgi:hypothetical protein